jgi:hypothetical protein
MSASERLRQLPKPRIQFSTFVGRMELRSEPHGVVNPAFRAVVSMAALPDLSFTPVVHKLPSRDLRLPYDHPSQPPRGAIGKSMKKAIEDNKPDIIAVIGSSGNAATQLTLAAGALPSRTWYGGTTELLEPGAEYRPATLDNDLVVDALNRHKIPAYLSEHDQLAGGTTNEALFFGLGETARITEEGGPKIHIGLAHLLVPPEIAVLSSGGENYASMEMDSTVRALCVLGTVAAEQWR